MLLQSRPTPLLITLAGLLLLLSACEAQVVSVPPIPQTQTRAGPSDGARMIWRDGTVLAYDTASGSWKSQDPITYGMYADCLNAGVCTVPLPGKVLSAEFTGDPHVQHPDFMWSPQALQDGSAAEQYCGSLGGTGVISSPLGFLCEYRDPPQLAPSCDPPAGSTRLIDSVVWSESTGAIQGRPLVGGPRSFRFTAGGQVISVGDIRYDEAGKLTEFSLTRGGETSVVSVDEAGNSADSETVRRFISDTSVAWLSVRGTFCTNETGGVTFEDLMENFPAPVKLSDPTRYEVTSDAAEMQCSLVDDRLACTGGTAGSAVQIVICDTSAEADPSPLLAESYIPGISTIPCAQGTYFDEVLGECVPPMPEVIIDEINMDKREPSEDSVTPEGEAADPSASCLLSETLDTKSMCCFAKAPGPPQVKLCRVLTADMPVCGTSQPHEAGGGPVSCSSNPNDPNCVP